jgi:hypothetical protein
VADRPTGAGSAGWFGPLRHRVGSQPSLERRPPAFDVAIEPGCSSVRTQPRFANWPAICASASAGRP